jgi:ABC-2 type transport system permease protein
MGTSGGLWLGAFFGILFAMALFSYLYTPRAVGMFHSLPLRRESLFLTDYLTGAAVFLSTLALTALLTAAVQGAAGVPMGRSPLVFFACAAGQMFFFYSFACLCAFFTGQLLALPIFYIILNGVAMGLNLLVQNFASAFLYGYSGGGTPAWVSWLTPVWQLVRHLQEADDWDAVTNVTVNHRVEGLSSLAVYVAAGVVLVLATLVLCRFRRSETAGDTVAVSWAKPVFCAGVAACCALSLGQGLYYLIWAEFRSDGKNSLPAMLGFMLFAGLVGYYAAQMLLKKSFRVFRRSWRGAALVAAGLVVFGLAVRFDLLGVESRVPDAADVKQVDFTISSQGYLSGTVRDPALIEQFRQAHLAVLGEKEEQRARQGTLQSGDTGDTAGYFQITYVLKDDTSLSRSYSLTYGKSWTEAPDGALAQLSALAEEPGVLNAAIFGGKDPASLTLTGGELTYYRHGSPEEGGYSGESVTIDAVQAKALLAALQQDMAAGRVGANLLDPERWESDTYADTLSLYYEESYDGRKGTNAASIRFSTNATALLAALRDTGIVGGEVQLTLQRDLDQSTAQSKDLAIAQSGAMG